MMIDDSPKEVCMHCTTVLESNNTVAHESLAEVDE